MNGLRKREESEARAMTSPIDTTGLLRRLNDADEQAMSYPAIDEYEHHIDFTATDILHGWRGGETDHREALFADAFANAFRVLVLAGGQQVIRRTGREEDQWVWEHTGHIAGWTVSSYTDDDPAEETNEHGNSEASYYGAGRERWFVTAAEAAGRASEIASVAGEHCRKVRVVVRGVEVCRVGEPAGAPGYGVSVSRVGAARGESG